MNRFIQNILEVWGLARFEYFSGVMADESMYTIPFVLMILAPLTALVLYYKIMDSISGANIGRWLVYGLISSLVVCLISFFMINSKNSRFDYGFAFGDIFGFLVVLFLYSMVLYVLGSFLFRYLSTHRRYVPM